MDIKGLVSDFETATGGEVAVGVIDLKNNIKFTHNETKKFTAASLNKLFVVSLVLEKVKNKELAYINEYQIPAESKVAGTGIIHLLTQKSFNLHDLCMLAIIESDNTAANKLIDLVGGIQSVNDYIQGLGLIDTKLTHKFMQYDGEEASITSLRDLIRFFTILSENKLALSQELKEMLLEQKMRYRTPAFIKAPMGLKTADLPHPEAVVHDAGIIFDTEGDIVLAVLTEGVKDRKKTQMLMQKLAKNIYDKIVWEKRLLKKLPVIKRMEKPIAKFTPNSYAFGEMVEGWGRHLGQDFNIRSGTKVEVVGDGIVVYSALHAGSKSKPNWGNIIIIAHNLCGKLIFSLYGHLENRLVELGEVVRGGAVIGTVGPEFSIENGWWEEHLHFAIYQGEFEGVVLAGYSPPGVITDWLDPKEVLGL